MTGTTAPAPAATPGRTSTAPGPAQLWARARGPLLALAVLLLAGIVLAALNSGEAHGRLDPRSADPQGTRALAELLSGHGIRTHVVTTTAEAVTAAAPGTTLVVTSPGLLTDGQRETLKTAMDLSGGRTVLLSPGPTALAGLVPGVTASATGGDEALDPRCAYAPAVGAGRATTGEGLAYTTTRQGAASCYPDDGPATLLVLPGRDGADTVLLGSPAPLLNENLADEGNASLALQLLGTRTEVTWYLPTLADPAATGEGTEQSFSDLIPDGWSWALLQLLVAAVLAAAWRARRLGPLVHENLPVAIRASEATEGRARLYRKADARDRAAQVLRAATRERLAALLGVPPAGAHDPATLTPAVSAQLPGDGRHLTGLLFGPAPTDDAALVALTDHLDALEREVRSS
ncbi:DUF4350 domain-containing protein [Streptomyces sp. NPDC086023]|uniref:DUF4350 domain-containing protein n=1 Tax=Streptomyces sp. NPDC086023 TaxID=3365746 RepID=UPI0037D92DEE